MRWFHHCSGEEVPGQRTAKTPTLWGGKGSIGGRLWFSTSLEKQRFQTCREEEMPLCCESEVIYVLESVYSNIISQGCNDPTAGEMWRFLHCRSVLIFNNGGRWVLMLEGCSNSRVRDVWWSYAGGSDRKWLGKNEDYFPCLICIFGIQIDFLYSLKILIAFFYFCRSMYCTVGMILGTE
jgi:hypothetical protein